jgi:hypothetical protein
MSENIHVVELKNDGPLTLAEASRLTEALHAIKNAPRAGGALKWTAADLLDWCTGGYHWGRQWSPREQADWLVQEARATWDEWEGPKALRDLFLSRFGQPELQTFQNYEKPITLCQKCRDQGALRRGDRYTACDCEVGRALTPSLLEVMNGVKSIDARREAPVELPTQLLQLPGRTRSSGGE